MKTLPRLLIVLIASSVFILDCQAQSSPTKKQLEIWLNRFPAADSNGDGELTSKEANAFRTKMLAGRGNQAQQRSSGKGAPREFKVDPGWDLPRFPDHTVSHLSSEEIKAIYAKVKSGNQPVVVSYPEPQGRNLRIVGTGHSFMAPGYRTMPQICKAAGIEPMLYTHTGGGMTGSARYKWEQENGIFQFDGAPVPKLLASIANANWDAMMFGPYFNDKPEYYACWIDFCLQHHPDMKFYLSDAWPQLYQLGENPKSEAFFTEEVFDRLGTERRAMSNVTLDVLRKAYPGKIFVLPTSDAMVLAAKVFCEVNCQGSKASTK